MTDFKQDPGEDEINLGGWDRRQFGKILVAGVGGLALENIARAELACPQNSITKDLLCGTGATSTTRTDVDVVVVGAGLSGLIAARELKKLKKAGGEPVTVRVLEARDRIGGRMYGRKTIEGGWLDYGGQWVGKTQYDMQELVNELKITPFDSYEEGRSIQSWKDKKTAFNGSVSELLEGRCRPAEHFPGFPERPLPECRTDALPNCDPESPDSKAEARVWGALLDISKTVCPSRPWETKDAKKWDAMTFQEWLESQGVHEGDYTQWLPTMQARIGGSGGFEPKCVSVLHMAWTQRVGAQGETPEQWLLFGGAGQIPPILAEGLKGDIELNRPVCGITQLDEGGVVVTTPTLFMDGRSYARTFHAKAVIVAIPPQLRARINFVPPLNEKYTKFMNESHMGSMSKVHAVYERAFWRDECLSGSAAGNLDTCEFIADSSPPSGVPGILTSFIAANRNRELTGKSKAEIRELVLKDYEHYFGKRVWEDRDFEYVNWDKEAWTGGAFTTYLGRNVWTTCADVGWREPVGDIFWAGTETSDRWPGYFDGAVHAGKHAARCVQERLKSRTSACDWEACPQPV